MPAVFNPENDDGNRVFHGSKYFASHPDHSLRHVSKTLTLQTITSVSGVTSGFQRHQDERHRIPLYLTSIPSGDTSILSQTSIIVQQTRGPDQRRSRSFRSHLRISALAARKASHRFSILKIFARSFLYFISKSTTAHQNQDPDLSRSDLHFD